MKTRDIKELLILLRDYIETEQGFIGMCFSTNEMVNYGWITENEELLIDKWNVDNRPSCTNERGCWWPRGDKQPRLDWLNEQIAKL